MSETAAQGTLAFATWIQVAELEDLTGNATFGAHIQVGFDKGRIVGARAGEAEGLDGLVAAFLADPSRGGLTRGEPLRHGLSLDATGALLTGLRLVDEWERLQAQVFSTQGDAPERLAPCWEYFDGQRTVVEVFVAGGLLPGLNVDALASATEQGLLVPAAAPNPDRAREILQSGGLSVPHDDDSAAPAGPGPRDLGPQDDETDEAPAPPVAKTIAQPAPPPVQVDSTASFWDLMDRAHDLTRSRDFASAESCLRRALELRPGDALATQNLRRISRLAQRG